MNYLGQADLTEMMGMGSLGEVRRGPDGDLYQWVEGIDGLGNPVGFWSKIKSFAKKAVKTVSKYATKPYCIPLQAIPSSVKGIAKQVCRVVGKLSPLAHVPVIGSYYNGAAKLCKIAKDCGIAGLEGGLMQAPDGTTYQVQGLGADLGFFSLDQDEVLYGLGQEDLTQIMGIGNLGQVRRGPDGELYQWVEGFDGLGRRVRHWRCKSCMDASKLLARRRNSQNLPAVQPAPQPAQANSGVINGLGDLYQAPNGSVYNMDDIAQSSDLFGLAEDQDIYGFSDEEDLTSYGDNDDESDIYGYGEDEDLTGYGEGDESELYGYIKKDDLQGLGAYVKNVPPGLRKFQDNTPETWRALW
jgi:hypothetical protein